jgi:hypothetical protein
MTDIKNILYSLLFGMVMVSCSFVDDKADDPYCQQVAQQVDLLVSVGNKASMPRRVSATASRRAPEFSTMDLMVAIPFRTNGVNVTASDDPLIDLVGANESNLAKKYDAEKYNTYYVNTCHLMTGTDRMLVYGKATKPSTTNPAVYGELSPLPTVRKKTADIQFSLTSIRESTEAHADATALANYMTTIANTTGWSTTDDSTLKSYYLDFIRMGSEGAGLMSGAAANIKAFVAALRALLETKGDALSSAIIANIDGTNISTNTYPRSLGLPDGAAVIRWTGNKFEVRTTTTTLDNINGINRYTYPAELMFFVDSPIRTSAEEVKKKTYQENTQTWDAFLDTYYNGSNAVNTNTKAVAVENPIQYGVGRLDLTLTTMSATLKDAKDEVVTTNANMTTLPLIGVIIGGQHTVGFNMKPQGEQTDVDGRFIYDTNIIDGNKTSTLVLQSYVNEKVPVILEFENKTGNAFTGKDGTVYPGARFYLIAMADPANKGEGDFAGRVFTQDYTTTMSMSVTSLAKAYTCMPDLLAPRLEVGVQVVTKWIQATTTNVELR